ncbi:hypothetical protein ACSRB4_22250, partial [Salmonella enterica]|uniref:hypothetical protein n=1 Tax=Salmonella enterica TaxID=28901 RepID=UPI003EDBAD67
LLTLVTLIVAVSRKVTVALRGCTACARATFTVRVALWPSWVLEEGGAERRVEDAMEGAMVESSRRGMKEPLCPVGGA